MRKLKIPILDNEKSNDINAIPTKNKKRTDFMRVSDSLIRDLRFLFDPNLHEVNMNPIKSGSVSSINPI